MDTFEYKGRTIELEEGPGPRLSIDGEPTEVSHDAAADSYNSATLPYRTFDSVRKVAEAIIDQTAVDE